MTRLTLIGTVALVAASGSAFGQTIAFDQNVTSNVIFGSGNANGAFTTSRGSGLEIGLRAKLRFDGANQPQNVFNSNGDGSYTYQAGLPPTGFGFAPGSPSTAVWNFEWSVNTNFDASSGLVVGDYTYEIGMDADPTAGTNFLTFDPIIPGPADHAFGDNSTANGAGTGGTAGNYAGLLTSSSLVQNSWNYEFFKTLAPLTTFDPTVVGDYEIYLAAFSGTTEIGRSTIHINVVPSPASAALMGLGGLVAIRRRR